jgi:hypothetical protein
MYMSPQTPTELDSYPNVFFTSDKDWNPQIIVDDNTVHDMDLTDNDFEHNEYHPETVDAYGELLPVVFIFNINEGINLKLNNCHLILALSLAFVSNTR